MSELSTSAVGRDLPFFTRVKTELKKLFVHVPGWEASAAATLTYVAPLVEAVLTLVDPAATPVAVALVEKIQSAMAAAAVVIKAAESQTTLATYLNAIKGDAGQILSTGANTDPVVMARLSSLVSTITAEVDAILAELNDVGKASKPA